jgi:hypothetical protein
MLNWPIAPKSKVIAGFFADRETTAAEAGGGGGVLGGGGGGGGALLMGGTFFSIGGGGGLKIDPSDLSFGEISGSSIGVPLPSMLYNIFRLMTILA